MSNFKKGQKVWNKGVPMSEESKEKLKATLAVIKRPERHFKHSDEFKRAKSAQMKEYFNTHPHGRLGKKHTLESIEKMRQTKKSKNSR